MMNRPDLRTGFAMICGLAMLCQLAGCGHKNPQILSSPKEDTVKIPIIFLIDAATGKRENEDLVNEFNKEYEGVYEVEAEWMAVTSGEYRSNLKRWNVADELPAVITDVCFSPAFYELMLADDRLVDLAPLIDQDPEWKEAFEPDMLETCRETDHALYVCPSASNCFSYSGIFYHKKLFQKAGIHEFPKTWDDFFACCEEAAAGRNYSARTAYGRNCLGADAVCNSVSGYGCAGPGIFASASAANL